MWRTLISYLAALLVAGVLCLSSAPAQARRNDDADSKERPPPALPYTVAFAATILVLVVLCVPSRKRSMNS